MPRVICDLPNAGDEISGVKFHPLEDGGKISDEISQEQAEMFASIPGYIIDEDGSEPPKVETKPAPTARKSGAKKAAAEVPAAPPAPAAAETDDQSVPTAQVEGSGEGSGENESVF